MFNFKNALLVAIFALFSLGLQAAPIHTFPSTQIAVKALSGDGIVHIIQARTSLKVEVIVTGEVTLTVVDSNGNTVYNRNLNPQARRANINTVGYADGVYTLIAEAAQGMQEVNFAIGEEK